MKTENKFRLDFYSVYNGKCSIDLTWEHQISRLPTKSFAFFSLPAFKDMGVKKNIQIEGKAQRSSVPESI